ncbi:carboxylesterase/lipase family protein [Propionicicella superfundia]|uniref:carboxylesterase/lipase family protein n=1 Tax=Propionicicella superfundia TaxID=348582 RepID=UPI0003FBE71E|nr:carboxylesterase family protein [Propionicicella superfundia]
MAQSDGPIVSTPSGRVSGVQRAGHAAFLGIPFAEPPVGALRFAPPAPARPWDGVRPATAFGPTPLRVATSGLVPEPAIPGEGILTVSVFTPDADPAARLPVLVWIHGGGFIGGSPASPWHDGAAFARDGVVTVLVSYRLGFDGFGAIPGASANRGVQDWMRALEWVQEHIPAFGGDPDRVTLAGQSAGGASVLTLLGAPSATPLFRAVWASSPALPVRTRDEAEEATRRLAERLGVPATWEALAAVPEERVLAEQMAAARPHGTSLKDLIERSPSYSPVVDGELIPEPTLDALMHGVGGGVELVIGSNDNEIIFPAESLPAWLHLVPQSLVLRATGLRGHELREYRDEQRQAGVAGAAAMLDQDVTDRVFRRQVVRVANARVAGGAATRLYRFSWASPTKGGAIHCLDLPFLWDILDRDDVAPLAGDSPPQDLADVIHGAAVALAHGSGPDWPVWDDEHRRVAVLGGDAGPLDIIDNGYAALAPLLD